MATGQRPRLPTTRSFSQYEPLTKRLHNLLKDYRDGFSVPKELIQNADDAGAQHVCFLYDCRNNLDARSDLVNEGLAEFQGPALWSFNDAQFTEQDFENIRKLGGATKEEDTSKVGKFGLGFNSVYNITDIPSFISGNRAVIFDPHSIYLGECGRSTDLHEESDSQIIRRWKNQLKPFDGIFGCNLRSKGTMCNGTLFRFPLRTEQQAKRSEIKNLSYTDTQMCEFLKVFAKHSGNLLIFTQNVQCVTFFYLPKQGKPEDYKMLVHVRKNTLEKRLVYSDSRQVVPPSNILKYSSKALDTQKEHEELEYIDEQIEIEQSFSTHAFNKICRIEQSTSKLNWLLTWSIGCTEAKLYAKESTLKGLVPLAAVAIPMRNLQQRNPALIHLHDCGKGFYEQGHLFCFMPLPIETYFMLHVNATFALTSDRRNLCVKSSDNTDNTESEWNRILMTRVVTHAWVYGLHNIGCKHQRDEDIYYSLWPNTDQFTVVEGFVDSFYQFIVKKKVRVFLGVDGKCCSFQNMMILDPNLRHDPEVGNIAFSAFKQYMEDSELTIVDLPCHILDNFVACSTNLTERTCTEKKFFEIYFFQDKLSKFLSNQHRNALTKYALLKTSLRQLVRRHKCIPTIPRGELKTPIDLIHPSRLCASLYMKEENVFPAAEFRGQDELFVLEILGMKCDELSSEQILDRANYIQDKQNPLLSRNLVKYLNQHSTEYAEYKRFEIYDEIQLKLQNAEIFPVLTKPNDWPFHWQGGERFSAAIDIYDPVVINLVGCSQKLLDIEKLEIRSGSEILSWLGVKNKNNVDVQTVVHQLQSLYGEHNELDKKKKRRLSEICNIVYKYLDKKSISKGETINAFLQNDPCILTQYGFIEPQRMAMNLLVPLTPYLYQVEKHFSQFYPNLLKAIGVKDYFETNDICNVLTEITRNQQGAPLKGEALTCFCKAVQVLVDAKERGNGDISEIQLPSIDGHLHQARELCLNDCGWVSEQRHMRFLHPNISPKDGHALGVKTKREASLAGHMSSIPYATAFGQAEALTTRLRRILRGYPKDVSILKELLQNADDAGATELMFIKDFNNYKTEQVFGEEWKHLQGPALCVFNNSYFTEKDFQGIQNLGEGSKSEDPLKTGQFGVGFNVVYHLTDVPSWITVGPRVEKTLCVLDPHQKYIPRTGQPGVQFTHLSELRQTFKHVFPCYHEETVLNTQTGTLFRFPLRTARMADESRISQHDTTTKEIEQMLVAFKTEAWTSMLFLTNVKKISFASITNKGKLAVEYTVETALSRDDMKKMEAYRSKLKTLFPNPNIQNIDYEQVGVVKSIKDSNKSEKWLIVHQVGFMSSSPIPEDVLYYWRIGQIQLLPRGGVAISLTSSVCNGKLFCVLPLPGHTGLPVHINGHFVLGHEARRDLWHGTNDFRVQWNTHMIQAVICPSYIAALELLQRNFPLSCKRTELKKRIENYYKKFPKIEETTNQYIQHLVKSFYTEVGSENASLFPVILPANGKYQQQETEREEMTTMWVPVTCSGVSGFCGYFNTLRSYFHISEPSFFGRLMLNNQPNLVSAEKQCTHIEKILKDLGMKLVESSGDIQKQFDETKFKDDIHGTSPKEVTWFLKSNFEHDDGGCCIGSIPKKVQDTRLKSVENVKVVTEFCQKMNNFEDSLLGLPLNVTQSNLLSRFSGTDDIIVTKFGHLLPSSSDRLLHKDLVSLYDKYDLQKTKCMIRMTIEDFAVLMKDEVDRSFYQSGQRTLILLNEQTQRWICDVWTFVSRGVEGHKKQKWSKVENNHMVPAEKRKQMSIEFRNTALQPLLNWSLLPANVDVDQTGTISLYPLKHGKHIISLKNIEDPFEKILKKLPIPKLTKSLYFYRNRIYDEGMMLCEDLVASSDDPRRMLTALTNLTDINLTSDECSAVLKYFAKEMNFPLDMNVNTELKQLPFYPAITEESVKLQEWCQVFVVIDSYPRIPVNGLKDLFARLDKIFIKHDYYYERILNHLGLEHWSRERLYAEIIIPNVMQMSAVARMKHLIHIRDHIFGSYFLSNKETTKIIEILKQTPFVVTRDGKHHCVSDFYTSRKPEFKLLCPPSAFLPLPYDEDKWQNLLKELGLKYNLSAEDFVHLANNLQDESRHGITNEVKQKSKILTNLVQTREDVTDDRIWYMIRDIRFVLPFNITSEHPNGRELDKIHCQFENAERLVAFAECCNPIHCYTVWTSCSMWTRDADPTKHMSQQKSVQVLSELGVAQEPSLEHHIVHLQNISKALRQKDVVFRKRHHILLQKIFTDIYDYFQKHMQHVAIKNTLQSYPVVFITETCELVTAAEVVIELETSETIPGYIFRAPSYFGRFFDLFEKLGAHNTVSPDTYAIMLAQIHRKTKGKKLNANEVQTVEVVVKKFVDCLYKEKVADIETGILYLPNEECMLVDSSTLVLNDREDLAIRMTRTHLNFFLGYESVDIPLAKLHKAQRPVLLSSLVTETLSSKCSAHVSRTGQARIYEQRIKSSDFINGILRLCNAQTEDISTNMCLELQGRISNVSINQVENLETVLIFKGKELKGSEEHKSSFISMSAEYGTESTDSMCKIYISSLQSQESRIITEIAFAIDSLANCQLGRYVSHVEKMLSMEPGIIQSYLDSNHIRKYRTTNKSSVVYPKVGTLIPEEFHDTLFNKFFIFSVGEYVGLCVYDPTVDGVDDAAEGEFPVFVYAIVNEVENDSSPITARYSLEIEENVTESVSATMMFKFHREETDPYNDLMVESDNLDCILADIRCQLQGAWECLTPKERNRLRIRLLTLWHPDRNPENVLLCTKVCQHISLYVQRLDNGRSLDMLNLNTETANMSIFNEVSRRIRIQRQSQINRRSPSHALCHQRSKHKVFPHLGEALRWLKQAEKDLEAAYKSIESVSPSNWSCYQSHQAAEKALKAVLYTKDSQKADSIQHHNITAIASGLGMELEVLADQMNSRVGNYNALRYPDRCGYPRIPSERFSSSDARLCYDLAKELVDVAAQKVQRL